MAGQAAQQNLSSAGNAFSNLSGALTPGATAAQGTVAQYYGNIIKGGPAAYQSISPQIDAAKSAYASQRQTLAQTLPAGGAFASQNKALAPAEASTISQLYSSNLNNAVQGLQQNANTGIQGATASNTGQTNVGNSLANLSAQQLSAWTSALGGLAGGLGTYFGLGSIGGGTGTGAGQLPSLSGIGWGSLEG